MKVIITYEITSNCGSSIGELIDLIKSWFWDNNTYCTAKKVEIEL